MSELLCCFGLCCSQIGSACTRLIGIRKVTQLSYIMLVVMLILPVVVATFILDKVNKIVSITPTSIVLRMSAALFVFFFIILLVMLCRSRLSQVINEGLFCVKYLFLVALFVGALFLPSSILDIYASVSKITSIVYLAIQTIIIIDIFYLVAIKLVERYDQGETCCGGFLIGSTIIIETFAVFINVLAYTNFSSDSCGSTTWLSVVTSILIVVLPLVQLLGFNPQNSLLTTALVSLTISYISYTAQEYFKTGCVIRLTPLGYAIEVSISLILFALTTYGTLMGGFSGKEYEDSYPEEMARKETMQLKQTQHEGTTLHEYTVNWGWIRWHFYMCLGVMYLGMLFTNWQTTDRIAQNLQGNDFVYWLKAVISWLMGLAYIWTLVAPRLFPDRDFTVR